MLYIKFFESGLIEAYSEQARPCDVIIGKFNSSDPTSEPKGFRGKEDYYEKWEEEGEIVGVKRRSDEEIAILEAELESKNNYQAYLDSFDYGSVESPNTPLTYEEWL